MNTYIKKFKEIGIQDTAKVGGKIAKHLMPLNQRVATPSSLNAMYPVMKV
jgi:hypothetical protein